MKNRLLQKLNKKEMRSALSNLEVEGMDKKPLDVLRRELGKFSYNEIINALNL